ncbi:putative lysine-specific demethylase JMJ16 [Cajanus cajan]|uniref:putative lysine-specific demethylase JMJ16 n=1 Tax=Cajanus cajan TaxID=3821 RepID=UPI00098D7DCC|nr:putative lysine-specific demethylase JMJ16 [Cajanus cajan]XP_020225813.1 putative lysine-specific demethylase JMJ16 [Cajanus cajan]XP_020225820.1 putative lysine-specific demethylase JMJ16 [Cajanus cajan]
MMGTELMRVCVKEDNDDFPSVPPGFESYTSFSLKRVENNDKQNDKNMTSSASTSASESPSTQVENDVQVCDTAKVPRSLRRRPWINYGQYENCSDEDSDCEPLDQNFSSRPCLPRGVIRGCPDCSNCQKVVARWRPEEARRPNIEDAPVFYPTEEEFQDTLKYISSIRSRAEPYGICRIVPPSSWKPPCPLKEKSTWEGSKFATRVQRIDKLQNRDSVRKMSKVQSNMKRKRRRCTRMGVDNGTRRGPNAGFCEVERFGFEPGPEFTLETFQRYAEDFRIKYFGKNENVSHLGANSTILNGTLEPSVENIEGEYWRMVESPTEEIEVLYGADLETGVFGSGFPSKSSHIGSASHEQYIKSGWNLNNFARLPGSLLSYESSDISGVLVPWLYIGMCFSSFCWHVEDHHLYSLNYMHWGAPKMWYGVPGKDACKLEEAMRKHLPELFEEQPDLLHKLVTQLSPSILKSKGVPVFRCVQNPGDFVLTFPRAYHSGFNCGFNCAEAVNVAPVDWLPHGHIAIELYQEQGRKTSVSHDKLLLGAAREAVRAQWELNLLKKNTLDNLRWKDVCGKDGLLAKALKMRVEMERARREFLCSSSQALKMESTFDATDERECNICFFDLHLSAAGCRCSPDRYACLDHAKQFCSCSWDSKFFLFRYDISELNILVEALEGKLSAIYRWAKLDLGLALSSHVSADKGTVLMELNSRSSNLSHSSRATVHKETALHPSNKFIDDSQLIDVPIENQANSKDHSPFQPRKSAESTSSLSSTKDLLTFKSSKPTCETANHKICVNKEESVICRSKMRTPGCQLSQEDTPNALSLPLAQHGGEKSSLYRHNNNVILLSDDEDDEKKIPYSNRGKELPYMLAGPRDKVSPCNDIENKNLTVSVTDTPMISEKDAITLPRENMSSDSTRLLRVKEECHEHSGTVLAFTPVDLSCHIGLTSTESARNIPTSSKVEASDNCLEICPLKPQHSGIKVKTEDNHEKLGGCATSNVADNARTANGNFSCGPNNYRQKGPRIAKVVRRINCNVEPLEFGVVLSGKSWCSSQAIFPKGFRSRVRYINVLDPSSMCYYISEILDAGRGWPLFMVSLENCSSEAFIHMSAARCWELVREKVNQEIAKQHKLGRKGLPPLQPPGSLDGFEMFGFSSPAIVQAIEALDRSRVCNEYWDSRPYSRPQGQISQTCQTNGNANGGNSDRVLLNKPTPVGVVAVLRNLFKKANAEELNLLYSILNRPAADTNLIAQLLNEEIHKLQPP